MTQYVQFINRNVSPALFAFDVIIICFLIPALRVSKCDKVRKTTLVVIYKTAIYGHFISLAVIGNLRGKS